MGNSLFSVSLARVVILVSLTWATFNLYRITKILPDEHVCSLHGMPWSPIEQGTDRKWEMFPWIDIFTPSEFFGDPIEEADKAWAALLPG